MTAFSNDSGFVAALDKVSNSTVPGLQIYGGPKSLSHDFKIWPITFQALKAVGPRDPSFLVVKKSQFHKKYSSYSKSKNSTKQKVNVGSKYNKTCLKQPLKRQNKDLNNKW